MDPGTQPHVKLVDPEAEPKSHMEQAAGTELRSKTTPVSLTDPGNWTNQRKKMGPGNLVGTSKEDFQMGAEHPDDSRLGAWEGNGSVDHRSIRQRLAPGSEMDWAACVISVMTLVAGSGLGTFSASQIVNEESPCCSIHHQYSISVLFWQVMKQCDAGKFIFKLFIDNDIKLNETGSI